jgi:hypothetical protein
MNNTKEIDTTFGKITCRLVVYKDYIQSNGKWRLFWEDINDLGKGFEDESTVTGQPFFNTKHEAIGKGLSKYNIQAIKADW